MRIADIATIKELTSLFSKLTLSDAIPIKDSQPLLDIGSDIAFALFKKLEKSKAPPFIVTLLECSTGLPGWSINTLSNPFSALEKTPTWEKLSLENTPFVIFLDMLAASAQRYGGIGSDYIAPYFALEV